MSEPIYVWIKSSGIFIIAGYSILHEFTWILYYSFRSLLLFLILSTKSLYFILRKYERAFEKKLHMTLTIFTFASCIYTFLIQLFLNHFSFGLSECWMLNRRKAVKLKNGKNTMKNIPFFYSFAFASSFTLFERFLYIKMDTLFFYLWY